MKRELRSQLGGHVYIFIKVLIRFYELMRGVSIQESWIIYKALCVLHSSEQQFVQQNHFVNNQKIFTEPSSAAGGPTSAAAGRAAVRISMGGGRGLVPRRAASTGKYYSRHQQEAEQNSPQRQNRSAIGCGGAAVPAISTSPLPHHLKVLIAVCEKIRVWIKWDWERIEANK